MRRTIVALATIVLTLAAPIGTAAADQGDTDGSGEVVPRALDATQSHDGANVLVKLESADTIETLPAGTEPVFGSWVRVPVEAGETASAAIARLAARDGVDIAELDLDVAATPLAAKLFEGAQPRGGAADPLRSRQWHLSQVEADGGDGSGVTVAVLDTGISSGEDLSCHTFVAPWNARTRQAGTGAAADDNGHGTHVAGTIAQCTNNGIGAAGVAPGARLMPVKVLDERGAGTFADVAAGIDWARRNGADVITMSLGGRCAAEWPQCTSAIVDEAIGAAAAAGITLVAAAGNEAAPFVEYPAAHPEVIAVGATDSAGQLASYSNRGRRLDIVAPGGDVFADRDGDGFPDGILQGTLRNGAWGYWSWAGTSFAAPHVAGAAAVLRSAAPGASAGEVRAALRCTGFDGGHPGADDAFGHGELRISAARAWLAAGSVDLEPPRWHGAGLLASAAGTDRVALSWDEPRDCTSIAGFRVFVNGEEAVTLGGGARGFVVEGLAAGTVYSFSVEAVDPAGNWSVGVATAASTLDGDAGVVLDAGAALGLVNPATGVWQLRDGKGAAVAFYYGNPGDRPFMGDWDCDGESTPGLYRQSDGFVYLRNSNTQGNADLEFFFGNPGDVPLAGDFDGDGCDTVSLYRPAAATVYVINELGKAGRGLGTADYSYAFGDAGDHPFVGDLDGDGVDEVGVHRPSTGWVYLPAARGLDAFQYASPGDVVLAGDFDGDGVASLALRRPSTSTFLFIDGAPPLVWGEPDWVPITVG